LDNPDHLVDKYYHYVFPKHIIKDLQISFKNDDDIFWKQESMTFGRGSLWFNKESGKVTAINHTDKNLITKLINRNKEFSGSVYGDDFQDATDAYENKDFKKAYKLLTPYAEQGHASAQLNLGTLYRKGQGVPQNSKEAVKWYRLSAEQGDEKAQYNLAQMYAEGQGAPQDYKEAVRLYRLSAEQRFAEAQFNLGALYSNGQGVPQDYALAHMWFNLCGSDGKEGCVKNRNIVEKKMTKQQIEKAQEMARNWKPKK
jgi:hypothetical protein